MIENRRYEQSSPAQQAMVMWIIWAAILSGLFIIRAFAAPKPPLTDEAVVQSYSPIAYIGIGAAVVSLGIRLLVIPRIKNAQGLLPAMIVGLALAEAAGILGMFVTPADQVAESTMLFSLSVACVLVSAPFYARRRLAESSSLHGDA